MYYFSYLYSGAQADDELSCQMIDRLRIDTAGNETRIDVMSGGCDMIWNWSLIGGCEVASFPGSTTSECKFWRREPGVFSHMSMT